MRNIRRRLELRPDTLRPRRGAGQRRRVQERQPVPGRVLLVLHAVSWLGLGHPRRPEDLMGEHECIPEIQLSR